MNNFKTDEWQEKDSGADDVTRSLPCAVQPEKSLLSSMLQEPEVYIDLALENKLTRDHFYMPHNAEVFAILCEFHQAGKEIEFVGLVQGLLDGGRLEKCGGPGYFSELLTYAPNHAHFRHHMQHVKDKFILRSIIRASNGAVASAYEDPEEPTAILDEMERQIADIREGVITDVEEGNREAVKELMEDFRRDIMGEVNPNKGLQTGFADFDRMTGGLRGGELIVVAARPGAGKTSWLMNVMENICLDQEYPVLIFSAEMKRKQILDRLVFARAKYVKASKDRGYKPCKMALMRLKVAAEKVMDAALYIEDGSEPTISEMRAKARRMVRTHGIRAIGIDYAQICKSNSKQAGGSREREIAEISAGCKAMAKDLNVPVILLAQINRDSEKRTGKAKGRPRMADLRESGALEQDADIVGLLYRAKMFADNDEENSALEGRAEMIIAKNRNGATGSIPLTFVEELMRFETGPPHEEPE